MRFISLLLAALAPASVLSAPPTAPGVSAAQYIQTASVAAAAAADAPDTMVVPGAKWTMRNLQRKCGHGDTVCTWTFAIDTGSGGGGRAQQPCQFQVRGPRASRRDDSSGHRCGAFTVLSGWSGQFGPGQGFTVLSVVGRGGLVIWAGYTDEQLEGGQLVKPDQAYTPALIS